MDLLNDRRVHREIPAIAPLLPIIDHPIVRIGLLLKKLAAFKSEQLISETEIPGAFTSYTVKPTDKLMELLEKRTPPEK